ncbi:MAG: macro domain-containing protein [Pseudomonadota bacterium]
MPKGGHVVGDLLELALQGQFDVIVHGCNCFHAMGAGIAKPIRQLFPEAYQADKQTPYGDRTKLGTISVAAIERGDTRFQIVNAYTQFQWRGRGEKVDYDALGQCFEQVAEQFPSAHVGYPLIGAGLAGGDWNIIKDRIESALNDQRHTLVTLH